MSNFILIFLCLALGVLLKRTRRFPGETAQVLNAFVIHVSLPAVILVQIPSLIRSAELNTEMLIPISMAWICFFLSWVFFSFLGKRLGWSQAEEGALILTAGLGNTSFVGFPLLEAFYGPRSIPVGILIDQLGSFLVLSTIGLIVAARYGQKENAQFSWKKVAKNILTFPPFVSLLVAVLWHFLGTPGHMFIHPVFEKLGSTLVPLALVAVGFQLSVSKAVVQRQGGPLAWGLAYKLLLAPLLMMLLYVGALGSQSLSTQITILEAAMAPMITASVVASEFGLKAEIASLMVGIGIPLSLITVPLWYRLLEIIL
ncbi:AEC family transporter [Bdellovibrio sp. HCB2-146]|uniref:AEC family transporter n=1 Tax=Bdellovibrio sp. HCB2-146 TaxID=3394362 RepID=UPI0039BC4800